MEVNDSDGCEFVKGLFAFGADTRTRTEDLRITNALLYQLSHIGKCVAKVGFFRETPKYSARYFQKNIQKGVCIEFAALKMLSPGP